VAENNSIVKQSFGQLETRSASEVAAAAMSAMVEAEVKARYIMAMQNPRNIDQFRLDLLHEVERPHFVDNQLASGTMLKFKMPRGKEINAATGKWEAKYVEDISIRFVELAARCFKNIADDSQIIFESPDMRLVRVTVTDLENNIPKSHTIAVSKTVEKKGEKQGNTWGPPKGRTVLSQRMNSYNEPVYIVEATEEEVKQKQNSEISKTKRVLTKALLPSDIVAEAVAKAEKVIADKDKLDPDSSKRKILESFAAIGVTVHDIESFLGRAPNALTPKELGDLRAIYSAISSGEMTWAEAIENVRDPDEEGKGKKSDPAATMAEKLRKAHEGESQTNDKPADGDIAPKPEHTEQQNKPKGSGFGGSR
jgi:hypothetical protein